LSVIKKLAGDTALYGMSTIVGRFLNYLLVPLYTGIFSPEAYGVSAYFYAIASFAAVIYSYGMETAYFRFAKEDSNRKQVLSTGLWSVFTSSLVLSLLLYAFSDKLASSASYEGKGLYFRMFAIIFAADAISIIPFAYLRQIRAAKKFASLKVFAIAVNIIINLFYYELCPYLLKSGFNISWIYNPESGIYYMFLANIIQSLCVLPFFIPQFKWMQLGFDSALWKKMFQYAYPLIFMGMAGMVNETLDRILLKKLVANPLEADYQIGIYAANYKLAILITLFITAFRFAAEPFFFEKAKDQDAKPIYARVMHYFIIVCFGIFLLVTLYLDIFKYFIRTEAYWEGLKVVPILLLANVFLGIYYNLAIWYKLSNKTLMGSVVAIIGAFITIVLNYLLIPRMGYVGAAWTTLICYFTMTVMSYLQGQKHYPIRYRLDSFTVYFFLSLGLYFMSDMLRRTIGDHIGAILFVNTLLMGIFIFYFYTKEKDNIITMMKK
jgi:O-antigen/teichoic acid export membrane protein